MDTPTLSLSLTVADAAEALAFYEKALGIKELFRLPLPDGTVVHAEFLLGNCRLFVSPPSSDWKAEALPEGQAASCLFAVESDDPDASYARAVEAGCEEVSEPANQIWGVRTAVVKDPFGYRWNFRKVVEELTPEQRQAVSAAARASIEEDMMEGGVGDGGDDR
ncbi:MAG: VOC family protein [Verrucomicrobiota bacterium]